MDYGAFPPEFNSARMYSGPGSGGMLAAAAAWKGLAGELSSAGATYGSLISGLTASWLGPSAAAMAAAATPFVAWLNQAGAQAEQAADQATAAATAYHAAFAMTVPPPVIAANRVQLAVLVATNLLGQNTAAIAANEAQYAEMWAQDATAMYTYAGNSAAASQLTAFTSPPQTTNPSALTNQTNAVAQATGSAAGNSQASLSQLVTSLLQSLASPAASTSSDSGLSGLLTTLLTDLGLTGSSATTTTSTGFGGVDAGGILQSLISNYLYLPGFFGTFAAMDALMPIMSQLETIPPAATVADGAEAAGDAAAGDAAAGDAAAAAGDAAAGAAAAPVVAGDLGALGGLGAATPIGGLSVPPSWGWAAASPLEMLLPGGVPFAMPAADLGAGAGMPLFFGGLPRAAAVGAAAGAGSAAVKYGSRSKVMARPPAAGYPEEPAAAAAAPAYPVPAGFPTNGHAPPGYRPAIVYLPTNGHVPAKT